MALRIVAIICARNEELHIASTLSGLIAQRIEVVLIDHGSTDATRAGAAAYLGRGLLGIQNLARTGVLALAAQLEAHARIITQLDCDWVIHVDADEWLQAPFDADDLRVAIEQADTHGYNCLNFEEFVFVPRGNGDYENAEHRQQMRDYYFFAPSPLRLM